MKNLADLLESAKFEECTVFVCGNGGSAATAEHFTNDLFSHGIKAICLNSNVSIITMIGNDYGYEYIFSKQLERYAEERDLLITISCSGTSRNIVNAQTMARTKKMEIFTFETFKNDKDYGKLEDKHLQLVHEVISKL